MTKIRDRFFAGFGALLLLVTGSALTIAVIVNGVSNSNKPKTDPAATTPQTSSACESKQTEAAAEALPETFKPEGAVTKLESTDLQPGSGPAAKKGSCLNVKYYGTLASDGTVFDQDFDKPAGFQFELGSSQVIPGWDQGLEGVKAGGTRRLVIPSNLAYGDQGQGSIPANAALVFVVKVLAVK